MVPTDYIEVMIDAIPGMSKERAEEILAQLGLELEISDYFEQLVVRLQAGEEIPFDKAVAEINELAREKYGCQHGVPLPSILAPERILITAAGTPMADTYDSLARTEEAARLARQGLHVRNSWHRLGDEEVMIIDTEKGPMVLPRWHAGIRLSKLLQTAVTRSGTQQTAAAEFRAMASLKKKINKGQWESYVLNGCFPEPSPRSGIHYIFRKGYPTLAVSYHGEPSGRVLAALCFHPMGYYAATFCGIMTPTDEVIAQLLTMRGDERKFWAKSGQWPMGDPRCGL